jgi:hypothetical protein
MLLCCCRGAGVAVGGQDSDLGAREEYPPPPARGGGELPGPPSRGHPGERETAEERAERRRRDEIRGVSRAFHHTHLLTAVA